MVTLHTYEILVNTIEYKRRIINILLQSQNFYRYGIAFDLSQPMLMVRDLELIKCVLIKDFWHFSAMSFLPPQVQNLECNDIGLASKEGLEWKAFRQNVSPAFSIKNLRDISLQVRAETFQALEFASFVHQPIQRAMFTFFSRYICRLSKHFISIVYVCRLF